MGPRCTPTRRSTPIATMSGSRARSSKRPTRSTAPRTSGSATLVATSWPPSWPPARGGGGGCARPSADWRTSGPGRPGRFRAHGPRAAGIQAPPGGGAPGQMPGQCRLRGYRARGVMRDGRRFGAPPKPFEPPPTPAGKVNVTDPDSRNVKTPRGYVQGYNAQAAVTERQIVVAAEINTDSPDFGHLGPMVDAARTELAAAGVTDKPRWWSPMPATGTRPRWTRSSAKASRS